MKFLIVGDMHIKYTAPVFRKNTYYEELLNKIDQINVLMNKYTATPICLGDLFNSYVEDYFETIAYDLSSKFKGLWSSIVGNHDCKNLDGNLKGTSFGVLNKANILLLPDSYFPFMDYFHYYKRKEFTGKSKNKIAFIHDYVMPNGTNENFEYKECFENDYKIVFCGHYHYPFDVVVGQTRYINPGSLMRSTIKELELNRTPEVILFDSDTLEVQHIPLKVKPLQEVSNPLEENKLDSTFESKFVDMLLKNDLNGDSNDIISLLQKNKVDDKIIEYIKAKMEEI